MDNNISFSKIVSTPNLNSWSQVYNAGKLFAVISLEKKENADPEQEPLNVMGKKLLEKLEQEFFTIEEKNLDSIKKAVFNTFEGQPEDVNLSFAASVFSNNVLYLFSLGFGKAFVKRDGDLREVLHQGKDVNEVVSSSGFVKENDLIILITEEFSKEITPDDLKIALESSVPSEITESLAPIVHKKENGKISAIVIEYKNPPTLEEASNDLEAQEIQEKISQESVLQPESSSIETGIARSTPNYVSILKSKLSRFLKKPKPSIPKTKKMFLLVAVAIFAVLVFSIFYTIQDQKNAKTRALFAEIYPQAEKKYEEGQDLLALNKSYARDSFLSAQKILQNNQDQFTGKSKESSEFHELLEKVNTELDKISPQDASGLDRSTLNVEIQNGSGIEGAAGKAADLLKEDGYKIASTGNADNYDYEGVTIKVKEDKKAFIDLLKKDLSKEYKVSDSSSDLPSSSSSDALIIVGK